MVSPFGHATYEPSNIPLLAHGFGNEQRFGPIVIAIDITKLQERGIGISDKLK